MVQTPLSHSLTSSAKHFFGDFFFMGSNVGVQPPWDGAAADGDSLVLFLCYGGDIIMW